MSKCRTEKQDTYSSSYFYFRPDLFDWNTVASQSPVQRLDHAFNIARQHLGIEKLLDPEG